MRRFFFLLGFAAFAAQAQTNNFVGKTQPGAELEHFTLTASRAYDGIWDASKSQIHIVVKSDHVANLHVEPSEIVARKKIGDGSQVVLYSDVDVAEKVLLANHRNYKAAEARLSVARQRHDTLHATYGHKNLPKATYDAVMLQYKAIDGELENAQKAMDAASAAFSKAQEAYTKAGGKKQVNSL